MKNIILSTLVITTSVLVVNVAQADTNAFSVGYAQSKVQDFKNIRGVNVKYRYEDDSPVSFISSLSYLYGDSQALMNPLMILVKIIKLRWIHILSYDQMVSR
ncbi:Ail/Lom family outer membrane beta-barrel protein, partial [Salmonella enterica]|uniref:Ail/Lom family outer membrane beta-barrel protein n=1 Tax=Salmonella enterica TaxID=28901 RepID=UPI0020C1E2A9